MIFFNVQCHPLFKMYQNKMIKMYIYIKVKGSHTLHMIRIIVTHHHCQVLWSVFPWKTTVKIAISTQDFSRKVVRTKTIMN